MSAKKAASVSSSAEEAREQLFTVETANDALVLVAKIVKDAVEHYGELMRLRSEAQDLSLSVGVDEQLEALNGRIELTVARLKTLHQELAEIGCELKDFNTGLVDFPAEFEGRKVWLCWKLGEAEVSHWHELEAGFAGRRPIGDGFPA